MRAGTGDNPIGCFGAVEEVAGVVAFLVSKDAGYVIGHVKPSSVMRAQRQRRDIALLG